MNRGTYDMEILPSIHDFTMHCVFWQSYIMCFGNLLPAILHQLIHQGKLLVGESYELAEQLDRSHMALDLFQILFDDLVVALPGDE